ncbi:acyl-CoA dehydrogenase family protein [Rhodococcus qingshengii]|uniref:acyl-CoA dehydrogenase family protein n=1 Tax=Rhodococcus qingshengii TaxID=334542 RepID=UPI00237C5E7F|nr:acyl-CoA dehydrogenase family protein [Rhodococcus qingshengii]WCT05780.1 acyl-CoA/acyl-ACP dehydrogenase [Rhodococcus qingshengii]
MDFTLSDTDIAWRDTAREWVDKRWPKERARELEASDQLFPQELWDDLSDAGFHGIGIPEEYGGQGGTIITQAIGAREMARNLGGLVATWLAPAVGGTLTLLAAGTEEQKRELLPLMAKGEIFFAIAVTEPGGGTDILGALRTNSRREGDEWVINGQKVWSTGAGNADYLVVLAKNVEDDGTVSGTNLILVPRSTPGLKLRHIPKLGVRSLASYEVFLDNVRVPAANIVGPRGKGWKGMVAGLNADKTLLASCATGVLDGILEDSLKYLHEREAFGRTIEHFQALQHKVVDIASWRHISELVAHHAAWVMAQGKPASTEATMAKLITSEYAVQAADIGLQLLGGMGYSAETDMQRYWRDARLWRIAPITGEMSRNFIAERLGMPRSF